MRRLFSLFLLCAALACATQTTIGFTAWNVSHGTGTPFSGAPSSCSYVDGTGDPSKLGYRSYGGNAVDCYLLIFSYNLASLSGATVSAVDIVWPTNSAPTIDNGGGVCSIVGQWYTGGGGSDQFWSNAFIPATAFSVPLSNGLYGTVSAGSNPGSLAVGSTQWVRMQIQCNSDVNYSWYDNTHRAVAFSWNADPANLPKLRITYTTNSAPTLTSLSGLGTDVNYGVYQTVNAAVADADGASTLDFWHVLLSYGIDGAKACFLQLYNRTNQLYLYDGVSSWGSAYTLGSATFAESTYCKVDLSGCSFGGTGANSTATLKFYFKPGLFVSPQTGVIRSYLYAIDLAGAAVGWSAAYTTTTLRTGPKLIVSAGN